MKPITQEWIEKAEGDFATLERECQAQEKPNYDGICFHAQQCVEKYLKAILSEAEQPFGKIHDLVALLEQVLEIKLVWEEFREDLAFLSDFSVSYRYPGESADQDAALEARDRCRKIRQIARQEFGLV